MIDLTPITTSTNITALGYGASTETLLVDFRGGTRYRYDGVPQAVYDDLLAAPSVGGFLARYIAHNKAYAVTKLARTHVCACLPVTRTAVSDRTCAACGGRLVAAEVLA